MLTTPIRYNILTKVVVNFHRTRKIMEVVAPTSSNRGKKRKKRNSAAQYLFLTHPSRMMMMGMKTTTKRVVLIWSVATPMYKVCHCLIYIFLFMFFLPINLCYVLMLRWFEWNWT